MLKLGGKWSVFFGTWYMCCWFVCRYAKEILQKEMLPHVGVGEYCETKKAYYFGWGVLPLFYSNRDGIWNIMEYWHLFFLCRYIIHRLLLCAIGRRPEDDRDHYGNKRLDLAGPLLGGLFRMVCLNILCISKFLYLVWTVHFYYRFFHMQLFRKLTRDVRSYVQKVFDPSVNQLYFLLDILHFFGV